MVGPIAAVVDRGGVASGRDLSASGQAWDAVLAYVAAAPVGARLPPERELASRLGVSRSTLRTALARLEALGRVSAKRGSGTVVTAPDPSALAASWLSAGASAVGSAGDALALRATLEPELASQAASGTARGGLAPSDGDDTAFHRSLAAASGNGLAVTLIELLVALSGTSRTSPRLHAAQHAAIAAAVADGDSAAAAAAAALHVRTLERDRR